jgi:hypothetical protein
MQEKFMSGHHSLAKIASKAGALLAGVLVFTVLLAAIPAHRAPAAPVTVLQDAADTTQEPGHGISGMNMDEKANEKAAVHDMTPGHGDTHSLHMTMTEMRPKSPEDEQRAQQIVEQLKTGIEKYKDYHVALNDGFKIFLPNVPQPEYHFTSYRNGFLEAFSFDPARPTSLLYKKTGTGYELVGAMYTMPKRATEDQLNARVPLSVAMWHLHTNLCMPSRTELRSADWTKFGLKGSIATQEACDAAGGRFRPSIFGWMVHVYPYRGSLDTIFAMHHMD